MKLNLKRNFLALVIIGILFAILFPVVAVMATAPTFQLPEGALDPATIFKDGSTWVPVHVAQDNQYGMFWLFMHNTDETAKIRYCLAVVHPAHNMVILFNWLEDGVIKFIRFAQETMSFVWDETVDADVYNKVVEYYAQFFGLQIQKRTNC